MQRSKLPNLFSFLNGCRGNKELSQKAVAGSGSASDTHAKSSNYVIMTISAKVCSSRMLLQAKTERHASMKHGIHELHEEALLLFY